MPRRWVILGLFFWNGLAPPADAWNKAGHMVSAAIAYAVLRDDAPAAIAGTVALLQSHPDYEPFWRKRLEEVAEEDRDLLLFMLAARWADDIRANPTFHHGEWHYINFPFKPVGQPESVRPKPPAEINILRAYALNSEQLKRATQPAERAVALAWIFHLIGDVHQPLHTTSLFTEQYPEGDRGGNWFYIRVRPGAAVISLHAFWDDLIIGRDDFQAVRNRATELRLRREFRRENLSELAETDFEKWAKGESFRLACEVAYWNGTLEGSATPANGPVLPPGYVNLAKGVAERRIVLAGYRLADVLARLRD
ncbi:MAG: S1/P1 nuclease [Gemmataceae bacterium]|nr:S1/P1 nuclease [Gemmataceae bacterium]MDW8266370.1 S1/P1 nuclease [Gemmataceae bacterium]